MKVYHITGGKIAEKYNYSVYLKELDGNRSKVRISDASPDGGANIFDTTQTAGRKLVHDENVPTKVQLGGPLRSISWSMRMAASRGHRKALISSLPMC